MTDPQTTEANTVIWSGEHHAYWRPNGLGYTTDVEQAGIWPSAEAEAMTLGCGPEKRIQLLMKNEAPVGMLCRVKSLP